MVFFSCDGCGEMLKKSAVDNHAARCRRCQAVSCVDCSVSFYGDDYRAHTSCISEVERYEKVKPKKNGKVPPQELWMELICNSIPAAPSHLKQHLQALCGVDNVPRKEKPFRNFTTNSLRLGGGKGGATTVSEIWNYLAGLRTKQQEEKAAQKASGAAAVKTAKQIESVNETTTKENETVAQDDAVAEEKSTEETVVKEKPTDKTVKKAMKKVLKRAKNHSLTVKLLRKSVRQHLGSKKSDSLKDLVQKNLKSSSFVLEGKIVTLKVD